MTKRFVVVFLAAASIGVLNCVGMLDPGAGPCRGAG